MGRGEEGLGMSSFARRGRRRESLSRGSLLDVSPLGFLLVLSVTGELGMLISFVSPPFILAGVFKVCFLAGLGILSETVRRLVTSTDKGEAASGLMLFLSSTDRRFSKVTGAALV